MKKSHLITILKFCFIISALTIIVINSDFSKIIEHITSLDIAYLLIAILCLNLSQIASAFRMRYYFREYGLELSPKFSIALFYVGMLYNNILPGGIGGDGYKVLIAKKKLDFPASKSIRSLISDRGSGLLLLILTALGLMVFSELTATYPPSIILPLFPIVILGYFLTTQILLKEKIITGVYGIIYCIPVQGFMTISALFLLLALGIENSIIEYLILFLIASVVGVIPISIGGIGIRELTFFYGAEILPINPEIGVAFALCFFAIYLVSSFIGIFFVNLDKFLQDKVS